MLRNLKIFRDNLQVIDAEKKLINTINAYSYNLSRKDSYFNEALSNCDILIPDGIGVVWAIRLLTGETIKKIAGADLFYYEMNRLQQIGGKCFFLGSTEKILKKIQDRAKIEFPDIRIKTYSPPYKSEFSEEDNENIRTKVNEFKPEVLFIGMTAPKQEKWAYRNFDKLEVGHVCSIGAVFDFYARTVKRAPLWMINWGFEWFYRLLKEPKRMWRRYLIGNTRFIWTILKEKYRKSNNKFE